MAPAVNCDGNVVDKIGLNIEDAHMFNYKATSVQTISLQHTDLSL